jgi:bacterioferritin-associated ferredoxin
MVDRCVCHHVPFTTVLELHAQGLSLPQIVERTRCGTGCGLCQPYLQLVCASGRARLPLMSPAQIAAALARLEQASSPPGAAQPPSSTPSNAH